MPIKRRGREFDEIFSGFNKLFEDMFGKRRQTSSNKPKVRITINETMLKKLSLGGTLNFKTDDLDLEITAVKTDSV